MNITHMYVANIVTEYESLIGSDVVDCEEVKLSTLWKKEKDSSYSFRMRYFSNHVNRFFSICYTSTLPYPLFVS